MVKEILGFSIYVFASSIIDMLYWATDKVLIGAVLGTVAVAVYNIGGTFTSMLQNMSSAISGVFGTRVNMMVFGNQPMEKLSELLIRIGKITILYCIINIIGLYCIWTNNSLMFGSGKKIIHKHILLGC